MNKLEAQAIVEATGNYDECEIESIMGIYEKVTKNIGFEDRRRDKRFIVKFPDIFYYAPDGADASEIDSLFTAFCDEQYELLKDDLEQQHIDVDELLASRFVGHYQAFAVDIPEITEENAIEIAMNIYDEFGWQGEPYVGDYVYTVEALQNMEDYYMDNWFEFLRAGEYIPEETIKEMENNYKSDKERRKNA